MLGKKGSEALFTARAVVGLDGLVFFGSLAPFDDLIALAVGAEDR